jgi:DNA-binding transcriptional MerR regulator
MRPDVRHLTEQGGLTCCIFASIEQRSILVNSTDAMDRNPTVLVEFYTGEVQELSGLSKHMVDYLCRHGLLTVSRSKERGYGKRRRFNFTDILLARSIKELLQAGVSVLSMRAALIELRRQLHSDSPATLRDSRIVIRGGVPYLSRPDEPPSDLLARGQMAFSFVLEIEDLWQKAEPLHEKREAAKWDRIERAMKTRRERMS